MLAASDRVWERLERVDRLEAFAAHPKIGDLEGLRLKYATTADWASGEQSGVAGASEQTLRALAEGNREYEARFGYLFIVCASGKTADEMLGLLRSRLRNDPAAEQSVASAEQALITRLRLRKLLA
jgi:2-oxo-4-hydroxy-4-carboxy-5-ureidoimidazoline decarboxylase